MAIYIGIDKIKWYLGSNAVKKAYKGSQKLYSSGNIVTYQVDSGIVYQEEVEDGSSCLSPKTFTPAKSGWTFVGWRQDTTASSEVLTELAMDSEPLTLYAVFKKAVTLSWYTGSLSAVSGTSTEYSIYNNGNTVHPTFRFSSVAMEGYTFRGWVTEAKANATIAYEANKSYVLSGNTTVYATWQKTITVTYYNNNTAASSTAGTLYILSGGSAVAPAFTLTQSAKSGWTARGWSTGTAGNGAIAYSSGSTFSRSANITLYGMYQQTITLSYSGNNATSGSVAAQTGIRYYNSNGNYVNPAFTLAANGFAKTGCTFTKWALGSAGGTQYAAGAVVTLSANTTMYAVWHVAAQTVVSNKYMSLSNTMVQDTSGGLALYAWGDNSAGQHCMWGQLGGGASQAGQYTDLIFGPAIPCLGQTVSLDYNIELDTGSSYVDGGITVKIIAGNTATLTIAQGYYQSDGNIITRNLKLTLPNDGVSRNITVRIQLLKSVWFAKTGVLNLSVSASP